MKHRVLFVCLGNICRSPLAEAVFRDIVERRGIADQFEIDSAGTGAWHVGHPPDSRMSATADSHGVSMDAIRGRQFVSEDLDQFDHIFAMDRDNLHDILSMDSSRTAGPNSEQFRVRLFREADPEPGDYQVPDPYYGGDSGFENVYQIVDRTCRALVDSFEDLAK